MNNKLLLKRLSACYHAVRWYGERDSESAWYACERGDWLLWICGKLKVDRRVVVAAACDCAETALTHVLEGENRPRQAIETARAWIEGKATREEVSAAATNAAAHAANAANAATFAAANAAVFAAHATFATDAAAHAAHAAHAATLWHCAELVRQRIPWGIVADAITIAESEVSHE